MEALVKLLASSGLLSFEDHRRRFDVGIERFRGVREAALRVRPVVKLHRDVEHHEVRATDAATRPCLEQCLGRRVRPGWAVGEFLGKRVRRLDELCGRSDLTTSTRMSLMLAW